MIYKKMIYKKTKSVFIAVLLLIVLPAILFSQEKAVRYEGSVSAGAVLDRHFDSFSLHTSHGVRFIKPGLEFLYLGCSVEQLFMHAFSTGNREHSPTFLQLHAKAWFPVNARIQGFASCEAGGGLTGDGAIFNFSPSAGIGFGTCGKQAILLTLKTYINRNSVGPDTNGLKFMLMVGYKF